jgi:hypothetical protein
MAETRIAGGETGRPGSRRLFWAGLIILGLTLTLGAYLRSAYWLSQDEATRRAKAFVQERHAGATFQSVTLDKRWDGSWLVASDPIPPIRVVVDRRGECTEP